MKHYSYYATYDATVGQWVHVVDGRTLSSLSESEMTLAGNFVPRTTEAHDLGSAAFNWNNAHIKNIATGADKRSTVDLGVIDGEQALAFIRALEPRLFRFKDTIVPEREEAITVGEVDEDGNGRMVSKTIFRPGFVVPHKRPHAGFFAQQVKDAMTVAGIEDCGVYAYDPQADTHELRLFEMLAFLVSGMQALMAKEAVEPDPVSEVEPAQHFADLMLADETADDARVRLSQRLRELRHYLMAPEIKVNEDSSVGLTPGEQSELQDLERRQTLGRWLDA
jgi:hypothetical protein